MQHVAALFEIVSDGETKMSDMDIGVGVDSTPKKKPKYHSVNGAWPEETGEGRDIKPTPQEAMSGAKRLYRVAMGRPFRGKLKLTSGRNHTWVRSGVLYVNPDESGGGWHEIVHGISHYASWRLHGEAHGFRHAFIERQLIEYVVKHGWLDGKLKREPKAKPEINPRTLRLERILSRIKSWKTKARRADTALRKLERQRRHLEKLLAI